MLEFPLLCRLCGSKTENGLYIYCDEGKRRQVETKIRLYLHFQVLPSDSLPKKICASCFEELEGMHRFAINALKVQDQLSKLSQELPLTAINVCKTFMTGYVHEPVLVHDTIASLTDQEVTEMEVQVDPMVFLEDDQIDENMNESNGDNGCAEADGNTQELPLNSYHGNVQKDDIDEISLPQSSEQTDQKTVEPDDEKTVEPDDEKTKVDKLKNDTVPTPSLGQKNALSVESEGNSQQKVVDPQCPGEIVPSESSVPSDSNAAPTEKDDAPMKGSVSSEPSILRRSRKGVVKNLKKLEPRSSSTENIKCTTYTCPICKKVFMKRGPFKAHLEVHKTDHKFACEICLRVFKKENNLTQHKKSHTEQTTFPCTHCNRVYPTMSTLRSHLVSHSDERPHVCSICSKSFKRNQDLKFHLNQHNGLRPYQCPYCSKAFSSSGNCFSHRRRAHMLEIERDRALRRSTPTAS